VSTTSLPFDSDALRANIASTAQEVVIPDRYVPLLEAVEGLHGVRASLVETLGEYFHAFRNVDLLVEGFQTILLRNWPYFERSEDRSVLFGLLSDLVLELLDSELTDEQTSLLLRGVLTWGAEALGGRHGDEYDESLLAVEEAMTCLLPRHPAAFMERDRLVQNLVAGGGGAAGAARPRPRGGAGPRGGRRHGGAGPPAPGLWQRPEACRNIGNRIAGIIRRVGRELLVRAVAAARLRSLRIEEVL
jgi:hypothetical protein